MNLRPRHGWGGLIEPVYKSFVNLVNLVNLEEGGVSKWSFIGLVYKCFVRACL